MTLEDIRWTSPDEQGAGGVGPERTRSVARTLRLLVPAALLVLDLAAIVAYAAHQAIEVPTYHLDGAFQTASGLIRLHDGALPGRDFYPYLGIGPVMVLYPIYLLAGAVLTGSVFAAYAGTVAALAALAGTLVALVVGRRSFTIVLGSAGVLLLVVVLGIGRFLEWPQPIQDLLAPVFASAIPGNSLRPVRAAAPLIVVVTSVLALTLLPRLRGIAVIGLVLGTVVACWSNDFALVPSAVVLAFLLHLGIRRRAWRVKELGVLAAATGVGWLLSGMLATGGHYLDYALYNFRDVLGDQFWYFGAWSRQYRVYSAFDLVRFLAKLGAGWGLVPLIAAGLWALIRPSLRSAGVAALGWAAFAGNTVAMIGGHFDDYYLPFRLWACLATIAAAVLVIATATRWAVRRAPHPSARVRVAVSAVLPVAALVVAGGAAVKEVHSTVQQRAFTAADPTRTWVGAFGGWLPKSFAAHVAAAPARGDFIEEYAGLWTVLRGPNPNVKVDAVIHALGDEREQFSDYVARGPREVVTTAPSMSTEWVSWNMSANWWLYRTLFRDFTPRVTSDNTVVWTRSASPAAGGATGSCAATADGRALVIRPAATGLSEVMVQYDGPGRGARAFTMLQNNIDSAADADGFVALDPGASSQRVPVYASDLGPQRLPLKNVPGGETTRIRGCSVTSVPFAAGSRAFSIYGAFWVVDHTTFRLTDDNFLNGLYRRSGGFVVNRSMPNIHAYRVGARIRFADGQVRRVIATLPSYNVLLVYVDGGVLPQDLLASDRAFTPAG